MKEAKAIKLVMISPRRRRNKRAVFKFGSPLSFFHALSHEGGCGKKIF
jgi:hypothetical protein